MTRNMPNGAPPPPAPFSMPPLPDFCHARGWLVAGGGRGVGGRGGGGGESGFGGFVAEEEADVAEGVGLLDEDFALADEFEGGEEEADEFGFAGAAEEELLESEAEGVAGGGLAGEVVEDVGLVEGDGGVVVDDFVAVGGVSDGGHDGVEGVDEGEEVEVVDVEGGAAGGAGDGAGERSASTWARRRRSVAASLKAL